MASGATDEVVTGWAGSMRPAAEAVVAAQT
jgi:hypothetical protein